MDKITIMTWAILIFSIALFCLFGRFTLNLIKQHKDIYGLLFALEEEEKNKERN